ncbi:hypothetical protein AZE42_14195 [Rhizopogon vesiculosus]|uniref:Uncharacterized protein n=1 Tax=Rhizopogon vesiculosus TaxID=180088 RepID=A0A1J8QKD1_9AGAM|nr:hypothetical protein AZE42_14195 [Rhizopogon vesiculosus]
MTLSSFNTYSRALGAGPVLRPASGVTFDLTTALECSCDTRW